MKMENELKHTRNLKCKFYNSGYCKFGETCRKRHYSEVCQVSNCGGDCQARHPRMCKMESNCRFFKSGICAFKHLIHIRGDKNLKIELEEK